MKVVEVKVIFESDEIQKYQKQICDIFYEFGVTGLQIEEPLEKKHPLDYYREESSFLMRNHSVSAYFPMNFYAKKRQETLIQVFEEKFGQDEEVVYSIDFYEHEEEDYQNSWKKYLYPEKISSQFVVKPTWREYEAAEGEKVIELDPGRAFGTGSHPTTSLCVDLMEEKITVGETVLDVGTGSGILMIVAEKLGARFVCGVDIDELAVEVAHENLELNAVPKEKYEVLHGNLIEKIEAKSYDVVVANILADVLLLLLKDISSVVKTGGKIIFSGIIEDKVNEVIAAVEAAGMKIEKVLAKGEWRALAIRA
ncbi:50S ribosomal protein L11 methyltransferase [Fusobacterium necrophorum subsp. funduliforme]|uniref:50S ribosomal protein L11 methyltransferase n=1 Tax=Fusobacterium necrophorum TaxID=859 RepID=UPI000245DF1B|nr:50S ribosomal protein L11 methyltransferase [Fusobacterium necrophorum]AVQ21247.1 50S ribosomal protein L11 methyltransferase [Fusobacterium necrophorum subsp. funduliforme]EHO19099.1 ribosomal protein L11 methyltransferase [Fusobacterium necrophorum subsp. funduliforme 1_1_36S]MBR8722876.1 Ribosomal protein L11 methyltransferase [Fusobacterium necrophorum subsp. funduliforme]